MHWYELYPDRWDAEQRIANQTLGDCRSRVGHDGVAFVEGVFHVRSRHGHIYESAKIRIEYPPLFPSRGHPKVVLLSHRDRWQPIADAHIYDDWSLCLFVPGECPVDFDRNDSLNGLFAVLQTFLFKEHIFQRDLARMVLTGRKAVWPGEARSHGLLGIAEAVAERGRIGRNEPCPCGSGTKFKKCCMLKLRR